ncbi:MAG: ribonuclease D, partial [Alphaproteobacteria bacterium]|nr:ribonuclease D [Alphaproteobacteria bacterium]
PNEELPQSEERRQMPGGLGPVIDLLKVLLKQVAEEKGVAAKLIATTDHLEDIAVSDNAGVPALHGWRRELFGNAALALKRGELVLGLNGRKVVLVPARGA